MATLTDGSLKELLDQSVGSQLHTEAAQSGTKISKSDLNAIYKLTRVEIDPESLVIVPVLAIDTKPTRNMVKYSAESQKKTVKKWVGTTVLFNSNGASDLFGGPDHRLQSASQVARIFKAQLVKTPAGETGTLTWVFLVRGVSEGIDEVIRKIDAGVLREVSIHVMVSAVTCSVCGKDAREDDAAHQPGATYDGKLCYLETVGALEPIELSFVACPGSVSAHVMQDDEVGDFPVLPLREALGGARDALTIIQETKNVNEQELAEARKACADCKETAFCDSHKEAKQDPPDDAAECGACEADKKCEKHAKAEDADGNTGDADDSDTDDQGDGKTGKKKSESAFTLFEGSCPACGRDGKKTESLDKDAVIAEFRESVETRIQGVVSAAEAKVLAAETRASVAEAAAPAYAEMFRDFVAETVDLAISTGAKAEDAREAYTTELAALSYTAVKAVREAHLALRSSNQTSRETLRDNLKKRAATAPTTTTTETAPRPVTEPSRGGFGVRVGSK